MRPLVAYVADVAPSILKVSLGFTYQFGDIRIPEVGVSHGSERIARPILAASWQLGGTRSADNKIPMEICAR